MGHEFRVRGRRTAVALAVGVVIGAVALGSAREATAVLLGAIAVAVATEAPVVRYRSGAGRTSINLIEAPAVALSLLAGPMTAMVAVAIGLGSIAASDTESHRTRRVGQLAIDLAVSAVAVTVTAVISTGSMGAPWVAEGVVAGGLAGAASLFILMGVLRVLGIEPDTHDKHDTGDKLLTGAFWGLVAGAGGGAVAIAVRTSPLTGLAAVAAMAGISVASWERARALERADRWQRLAELAALGASCRSETEIAEAAAHALEDLVDSHDVVIDVTPGDSGLAIDITSDRWLTLRPRGFPRGVHPTDLAQLRATGDVARAAIENLRLRRALEVAATTDGLTGTLNRARFDVELAGWCARASREHSSFVLAIIDGNRLKQVNDTYGHQGGDQAIRFLADRLRAGLRTGDVVARLGGDEFAVLAAGTSDVVAVCSRLLDALAAERCPLGPVSAAVGGAARGDDGVTPEQLFATADRRMYVHKAASRR